MSLALLPVVIDRKDMDPLVEDGVSIYRMVTHEGQGCLNLEQRVMVLEPGASMSSYNELSEDVLYVVHGAGEMLVSGETWALEEGAGALIPEKHAFKISNTGSQPLELVSVLSPQPGREPLVGPSKKTRDPGKLVHHQRDEEKIQASPERRFKLMVDPRFGAKYVTQFIGYVEKSRAESHKHTYEEVIYILEGEGLVHLDHGTFPMGPGSCVYLPVGSMHCLENPYDQPLRLMGVFCPSGSPANRDDS